MDPNHPEDQIFDDINENVETQPNMQEKGPRLFAGFWSRYFAFYFDALIALAFFLGFIFFLKLVGPLANVNIPVALIEIFKDVTNGSSPIIGILFIVFGFIFQLVYSTLFEGKRGYTIGKLIYGTTVVDIKRQEIDQKRALKRNFFKFSSLYAPAVIVILLLSIYTIAPFLKFYSIILTPIFVVGWLVIVLYSYMAMIVHKYFQNWYDSYAETLILCNHGTELRRNIMIIVGIFLHLLTVIVAVYLYQNPPKIYPDKPTSTYPMDLITNSDKGNVLTSDPTSFEGQALLPSLSPSASPSPTATPTPLPSLEPVEDILFDDQSSVSVLDNLINKRTGAQPRDRSKQKTKAQQKKILAEIKKSNASGSVHYGSIKSKILSAFVRRKSDNVYKLYFYSRKLPSSTIYEHAYELADPPNYPLLSMEVRLSKKGNCRSISKAKARILLRQKGITADFDFDDSSGINLTCPMGSNRITGTMSKSTTRNSMLRNQKEQEKSKKIPVGWSISLDQAIFD